MRNILLAPLLFSGSAVNDVQYTPIQSQHHITLSDTKKCRKIAGLIFTL